MAVDPNMIIGGIITFAGGGALAAFVKAWKDLRNGARSRDRDTFGSLRDQRDEADERSRLNRAAADHYHELCGRLVYQLREAGITPDLPPEGMTPPSQPARRTPAARRRRAGTTDTT